jgi:hypothetical protein
MMYSVGDCRLVRTSQANTARFSHLDSRFSLSLRASRYAPGMASGEQRVAHAKGE